MPGHVIKINRIPPNQWHSIERWEPECSCGWVGDEFYSRRTAQIDADTHLKEAKHA